MKAKEFDEKFDQGNEDVIDDLDLSTARRVNHGQKRINVDFPAWVVESLDREAARIGVTRQSIIKVWLVERLKAEGADQRTSE
ncbi:MAG: CopG family transcriptional regulator [Pseudohongiellaceae bacterium]